MRVVRFRTLKFRPRIATTMRPHGKWGDLLICIIPVSWCANIISNSNFILRMIEWQAEAGLFTIRIRGKQWYWVYKFELKSFTDILSAPKNIGRNNWRVYTPGDMQVANDYLHIMQLRSQNKWIKKYWTKYLGDSKTQNYHMLSAQEQLRYNFNKNLEQIHIDRILHSSSLYINNYRENTNVLNDDDISDNLILLKNSSEANYYIRAWNKKVLWQELSLFKQKKLTSHNVINDFTKNISRKTTKYTNIFDERIDQVLNSSSLKDFFLFPIKNSSIKNKAIFYGYNDFANISRWLKRSQGTAAPLRILKLPITNETTDLFEVRFTNPESTVYQKPTPHTTFLTMKQKRYARKKVIFPRKIMVRDELGKPTKRVKMSGKLMLYNNELFLENYGDATKQYKFFKKNKKRYENTSVLLSRRMLRTRRTLVLPAHVNLTAITNSYDVIHSWFIPGLGLKMDCIPGRSTHHTFYIDNVGFYYGQCAEICGRYHHHMPIRICALPFEHFLVWWHTFGLPKLISTYPKKRYERYYASRKYVW